MKAKFNKYHHVSVLFISLLLLYTTKTFAQTPAELTIEECYTKAKENYPAIAQKELITKSMEYTLANASKLYFPQINLGSQVSYQSDVTSIPISFPGINIPSPSKDQYKFYGELYQPLTDIISVNTQKELIQANAQTEEQRLEVELYKIKERINQIYFGVLLIDAQLSLATLLKKDIQTGINKMTAAIDNGLALKSSLDQLNAEMLKVDQRTIELKSNRSGFIRMLSLFMNTSVDENTSFQMPTAHSTSDGIARPELTLFELQKKGIAVQNKLITAKNIPHLGLFFQGGYGKPALNFLKSDFDAYYIGGLKLNWNISGLYSIKKERKLLLFNQDAVDVQKNTFELNTNMLLAQQNSEIERFQELTKTDQEIILLREKVQKSANGQLDNGTITMNDYLTFINAVDQARQNLSLHQIQLLMAQYNYNTTSGN